MFERILSKARSLAEARCKARIERLASEVPPPGVAGYARPYGDVGEGSVSIVAVERVLPPVGDEQVRVAVIVIVAPGG